MDNDQRVSTNVTELTQLLSEAIAIFREDRRLARTNYDQLREQLDSIIDQGLEGSEEYRLEKEVNQALRLVFDSGNRMEKVIESITKILVTEINAESRERVAQNVFGVQFGDSGKRFVQGQVNIRELLNDQREGESEE